MRAWLIAATLRLAACSFSGTGGRANAMPVEEDDSALGSQPDRELVARDILVKMEVQLANQITFLRAEGILSGSPAPPSAFPDSATYMVDQPRCLQVCRVSGGLCSMGEASCRLELSVKAGELQQLASDNCRISEMACGVTKVACLDCTREITSIDRNAHTVERSVKSEKRPTP
ncbi:MAG: hypothetical protein V3V08_00200 [Nannocystaceae bacterium]